MFFVDIGSLEREIDEAGNDIAVPYRNLPQQERRRGWREWFGIGRRGESPPAQQAPTQEQP